MSPQHPSQSHSLGSALLAATVALLAAAGAYVLPEWDAALPGGAIIWQAMAVVIALAGAIWARRQLPSRAIWTRAGFGRLIATAALLIALLWLISVGILWLVWPR